MVLKGGYRFGEETNFCRVCAIADSDHFDAVWVRHGNEERPINRPPHSEKRRRLVLSTSLKVVANPSAADAAAKAGKSQEWLIELREGDSPALAARQFVATQLGLGIRPEGTVPEVVAWPPNKSNSLTFERGGEEGERVVQWVTRRLEHEMAERRVIFRSKQNGILVITLTYLNRQCT